MRLTIFSLLFLLFNSLSSQELSSTQKDISELLEITGSSKIAFQIFDQMIQGYEEAFPDVPTQYWQEFREEFKSEEFVSLIIPLYEKYFTREEIKELLEFYRSPIGQKTISVTPKVVEESMAIGQEWGEKIAAKVISKLEGYMESSMSEQNESKSDSLMIVICDQLKRNSNLEDSIRIEDVFSEHLYPFIDQLDESQQIATEDYVYIRLQRTCPIYKEIIDRLFPSEGDWGTVSEKPKSKLNKKELRDFKKIIDFYYLESNGDTTNVSITEDLWVDRFNDDTYSKLALTWTSDDEIKLSFIESDNLIRKNLSKEGDVYLYQIHERESNYYLLSLEMPEQQNYWVFKLYFRE